MPSHPQIGKQKDQIQQKLRDHKKQWNATYKNLSQKLKAFKNCLNGKGDTKFSLPPSDIKEPFPNQIGSTLDALVGDYQNLFNDAKSIIDEQSQYSRSRRKKQPKQAPKPIAPQIAPQEDKIVDTLSRLDVSDITI